MTKNEIKIMVLGDICGNIGTNAVEKKLWSLRKYYGADMVVANAENAAPGNGLDKETAEKLFRCGVDVITSGNHIWKKYNVKSLLENSQNILRPANYPPQCPGNGFCVFDMCSYKVLVINLIGTVFMESMESPFEKAKKILESENGNYDFSVVDFHAEATSEKIALAKYLDGRVSAFFGTHTHVQTADEQVFKGGTGYITDVGMCGAKDSVLGVRSDIIIEKFLHKMPVRHEEATGECLICGCLFTLSKQNGKCVAAERINVTVSED